MAIFYLPKARIQIYFDEDPLNWNTNRYSDFFLPPHFCFASRPGNCRGFGSQDGAQSGYVAHRSTEMVNRPVNSRSRSMRAALAGLPTFRSDKKKIRLLGGQIQHANGIRTLSEENKKTP